MDGRLQILLIQARVAGDPMAAHELQVFSDRCELPRDHFQTFNVATDDLKDFDVEGFDALMIGGSGAFSLVAGGFDWHSNFLDLMRHVLDLRMPTFASCFGFQGIVQALGGKLAADENCAEIGTFPITLTEAGTKDPLFGDLPHEFDAQLGHNDSAVELSDELIHLASSDCCTYQAIRVKDRPVVATQFHPELCRDDNLDRFRNYLKNYKKPGQNLEEAMAYAEEIHGPSPHACGLLHAFVGDLRKRQSAKRIQSIAAE